MSTEQEPQKKQRPPASMVSKFNAAVSTITLGVIVVFNNNVNSYIDKLARVETRMNNVEYNNDRAFSGFQTQMNDYKLQIFDTKNDVQNLKIKAAKVEGILTKKDQFSVTE